MNYEFGKALPDQVTPERLLSARAVVAVVGEIDPTTIDDSVTLAKTLQGLARAVSDIVIARVADLRAAPDFDPTITPDIAAGNILRRFANPSLKRGRMFIAHQSKSNGATLGVHNVTENSQRITFDIAIPTDRCVDKLLTQEPCLWEEMGIHSSDFRSGRPYISYPFHNRFYEQGAVQSYFGVLQELTSELLEAVSV